GQRAQTLEECRRGYADAAFALDRLDEEAGSVWADRSLRGLEVVELDVAEARQQRLEALVHLLLARGADRRQGPPMEGVVEGDQLEPLLAAVVLVVGARGLDRAFDRLGAGIGEEHRVGEGQVDEALRELFPLRTAVEVRDVHQRRGLLLDRTDQPRVRMAEQVDRNPGGKVE